MFKIFSSLSLHRQLYHHGDDVKVSFVVRNNSNKTVKKINVSVVQGINIAMFTGGHHSAKITHLETTEVRVKPQRIISIDDVIRKV